VALKDHIIQESLKLFSLKGFLSTSITDIIQASDTSKGGFYNHFASKEELFHEVLMEAQRIWRERTLAGLNEIPNPIGKIVRILENYRDRYLMDGHQFPGGCIFITFSVELDDQRPHLCQEIHKGFLGLKGMLHQLLVDGRENGELIQDVSASAIADLLFSGMLGASVMYGVDKSAETLDHSINTLIEYLERLKPASSQMKTAAG
jgi:TetR/AcrR family transcriptional repressor of nem operon